MPKLFRKFFLIFCLLIIGGLRPASSEEFTFNPSPEWELRFAPYIWAMSIYGDVGMAGQTLRIDANPLELLEASDSVGVWMSHLELRKEKFSIYFDAVYSDVSFSEDVSVSGSLFPGVTLSIDAGGELDYQYGIFEIGGTYRMARWTSGEASTRLDLVAGGRYWYHKADLQLVLDGTLTVDLGPIGWERNGNLLLSGDRVFDWFDPILGLRVIHNFSPKSEFFFRGDIGGFGVGSDFSWQLSGIYSYKFTNRDGVNFAAAVGYRALSVDYSEGTGFNQFKYDVIQHGPVFGLSVRF